MSYTPWVDRPLDVNSGRWEWYDSHRGRVTWQAATKHKFNFFIDHQIGCNCGSIGAANTVETYVGSYRFEPNRFMQVTWNSPVTSRLLLEAGFGASISQWNQTWQPGVQPDIASVTDVGARHPVRLDGHLPRPPELHEPYTQRFSATYVTGSHTFKTGVQIEQLFTDNFIFANGNMSYTFRNGVPISLTQRTTPYLEQDRRPRPRHLRPGSVAGQSVDVQLGVRFDYFNGYVPAQNLPGPARRQVRRPVPGVQTPPTFANPWVGRAHFDTSRRHADLEGHQSAAGRRPTTSSATAGPRSRRRSAGTWPRPTSTCRSC